MNICHHEAIASQAANDQITFDLFQFDPTTAGAVSSWVTDTVLSKKYEAQSPEVNNLKVETFYRLHLTPGQSRVSKLKA